MENKSECPLCYGEVLITNSGSEFLVICPSGCLQKVVPAGETKEKALENFESFKRELELGAEMWGSKIRDGVTED